MRGRDLRANGALCAGLALLVGIAALAGRAQAGAPADAAQGVIFVPSATVAAAFEAGRPLHEQRDLKVHASRRVAAGDVEVHERDTDVIHVLSGAATFVTGGRMLDGREVAPFERRGHGIEGGESRVLAPGDVVVVPRGVPHWFRAVTPPFTYYVVKVDGGAESVR